MSLLKGYIGLYSSQKGNKREYKGILGSFDSLRFPTFSALELTNKVNGPQIRILRETSALEPAPKVRKPMSRSQHIYF